MLHPDVRVSRLGAWIDPLKAQGWQQIRGAAQFIVRQKNVNIVAMTQHEIAVDGFRQGGTLEYNRCEAFSLKQLKNCAADLAKDLAP